MSHPPLFLRLTSYQTNKEVYVLLSKVHGFERDDADVATRLKTFIENGMLEAFIVKERPEEIIEKARRLTLSFYKLQMKAGKEEMSRDDWKDQDDDDEHSFSY